MEFITLTYTVGDQPESTQTLSINATGEAHYLSRTNEQFRDRFEIGLYETKLDDATIRALDSTLVQFRVRDLPDHTGRMPEGIRAQILKLQTPAGEIIKRASRADPIDPGLKAIFDALDKITLEVMKQPRSVLKAEIDTAKVDSSGGLSLNLKFTNVGWEELWFRSPYDIVHSKDGWIHVEVWPAVPEPGSMWSEQKVFIEPTSVTPVGMVGVDPGVTVFVLQPKAVMRFGISGQFQGKSGARYVARISYCNFKEQLDDQRPVIGEVLTSQVEFSFP